MYETSQLTVKVTKDKTWIPKKGGFLSFYAHEIWRLTELEEVWTQQADVSVDVFFKIKNKQNKKYKPRYIGIFKSSTEF